MPALLCPPPPPIGPPPATGVELDVLHPAWVGRRPVAGPISVAEGGPLSESVLLFCLQWEVFFYCVADSK